MSERNDGPAGFEIPDLDLEPSVSKRPAPTAQRAAAPAPAPAPVATHGGLSESSFGEDDDFELIKTGASVELGTDIAAPTAKSGASTTPWPTGRSRSPDQLPVDPAEVAIVADYGRAPENAVLAPLYAYRVYSRRGALNRTIKELHATLTAAETTRETALAELAQGLRPQLEASDAFKRLLEPIREVERLAGDRSAALSQADAGFREQMARFDGEISQLSGLAQSAKQTANEKASAAELTDSALQRASAKHKRIQIEMRGVMDVARQVLGPAGGDLPPAQAAQMAELQARQSALEPELTRSKAEHQTASAALDVAQAEVRRIEGQIKKLERDKAGAAGALQAQLSARVAGVSEAESQRRTALADVARAVLASRGTLPVHDATLQALLAHDKAVEAHALKLETHLRALDSCDHERVRQGLILALSAIGLVVLAITLKAVL